MVYHVLKIALNHQQQRQHHRPDINILQSILVSHKLASDHLCIICHLNVLAPNLPLLVDTKRNLRMINITKLMHDIQENQTAYLHPTSEQIDNCLSSLLEKHAQPPNAEYQ